MLRMVILTTNIVESSVTIPDDDIAVDTSSHNRRNWNAGKRMYELQEKPVARDEALQRAGRTSRLVPGTVYRMISRRDFEENLVEHTVAQMAIASASELLLLLAVPLVIEETRRFLQTSVPSPPDMQRVEEAYRRLLKVGAGDETFSPTLFGRLLQRLPVEPELNLLIWSGLRFGTLEACEILAGVVKRGAPLLQDASVSPDAVRKFIEVRHACCRDSDLLACLRAVDANCYCCWLGHLPSRTRGGFCKRCVCV